MQTMLVISFAVAFLGMALGILRKKGLPKSVSSMVWLLTGDWRWCWTLWLWAVTLTLAVPLMDALPDWWKSVGFLTLFSMALIGAMPSFDMDHDGWHGTLAVIAGMLSQLCVCVLCPWWLFAWLLMPAAAWLLPVGKLLFCAEATCMLALYGSLFTVML